MDHAGDEVRGHHDRDGLRWNGEPSPLLRDAILALQQYTREAWPDWAIEDALPPQKKRK
jgi:hypothetical protein